VKKMQLWNGAFEFLPKLRLDEENGLEELKVIRGYCYEYNLAGVENNSIRVAHIKKLFLKENTCKLFHKLSFHEESAMEELCLDVYKYSDITELLKEENNSVWVGRVKVLRLEGYAIEMLPKLRFHEENVMEELSTHVRWYSGFPEIEKTTSSSIWVGKVKKLELGDYAADILPKLRIHEENVMEELSMNVRMNVYTHSHATVILKEMLKEKNNSVWVGRVKVLSLKERAVEIFPRLKFHGENEMDVLCLSTNEHHQL
ncbi:MAG: uncharacterized protein A8A55_3418, partial [Amphiamblys sp. WSBS2006]